MMIYTDNIKKLMKQCFQTISMVRFFTNKAFKNEPLLLSQFAFTGRNSLKYKPHKMIVFLSHLDDISSKHANTLMEVGAPETLLLSIKTQVEALSEAHKAREASLAERSIRTATRVAVFDHLYDILLEFSKAARFVFQDQPARRALYTLPNRTPKVHSDQSKDHQAHKKASAEMNIPFYQ